MKNLLLLVLCALIALLLLPRFNLAKELYVADVASLYVPYYCVAALLCVFFLFLRNKVMGFAFFVVVVTLTTSHFYKYFSFKPVEQVTGLGQHIAHDESLSVSQLDATGIVANSIAASDILRNNADLLILFNITDNQRDLVYQLKRNRAHFSAGINHGVGKGIQIISKYPLSFKLNHSYTQETGSLVEVHVQYLGQVLRVFAINAPKADDQVTWYQRNLLLAALENEMLKQNQFSPYTLALGELGLSPWSKFYPNLMTYRSCIDQVGFYSNEYPITWLSYLGQLGGVTTAHCFTSYRLKPVAFSTEMVYPSNHRALNYSIIINHE